VLYLFVTVAYWRAGVERAEICMDAEAVRTPQLRMADGATLLIVYALGERGLTTAAAALRGEGVGPIANVIGVLRLALVLVLGALAAVALRRRRAAPAWRGLVSSSLVGIGLGMLVAVLGRGGAGAPAQPARVWLGIALTLAAQEAIFRGVVQRTVEEHLEDGLVARQLGRGRWRARLGAAAVTVILGLVAVAMGEASRAGLTTRAVIGVVGGQLASALARALTGRLSSAWIARLAAALAGASF
jgi:hypothetical protein